MDLRRGLILDACSLHKCSPVIFQAEPEETKIPSKNYPRKPLFSKSVLYVRFLFFIFLQNVIVITSGEKKWEHKQTIKGTLLEKDVIQGIFW